VQGTWAQRNATHGGWRNLDCASQASLHPGYTGCKALRLKWIPKRCSDI